MLSLGQAVGVGQVGGALGEGGGVLQAWARQGLRVGVRWWVRGQAGDCGVRPWGCGIGRKRGAGSGRGCGVRWSGVRVGVRWGAGPGRGAGSRGRGCGSGSGGGCGVRREAGAVWNLVGACRSESGGDSGRPLSPRTHPRRRDATRDSEPGALAGRGAGAAGHAGRPWRSGLLSRPRGAAPSPGLSGLTPPTGQCRETRRPSRDQPAQRESGAPSRPRPQARAAPRGRKFQGRPGDPALGWSQPPPGPAAVARAPAIGAPGRPRGCRGNGGACRALRRLPRAGI